MTRSIDLNCDLGEDAARIADGRDAALLELITSANIACGGHAGDEMTMRAMVRAAAARGVNIGAHPGYPDRARFGRVEVEMPIQDLRFEITDQIRRLARIAHEECTTLRHVKPHGALYHAAMSRRDVAEAIAEAARPIDPGMVLVGLAGAPALEWWRAMGFRVMAEAFADRRYEADGSLRSRSLPGALIESPEKAAAQALQMYTRGADTICIHSDTPRARDIALAAREALEQVGAMGRGRSDSERR